MQNLNPYILKKDEFSSHSKILKWLEAMKNKKEIIEVGIAEGIIGKIYKERDFRLVGVEINERWAKQAENYYDQIIVDDIRSISKEIFGDTDCIILADILEHLENPQDTLNQIVKKMPEKCCVIISVPNIANIWIRINLLVGKFDYSDRGILDNSHLRFFTKKTFVNLVKNAQLSIVELSYTSIPLDLINPFFAEKRAGKLLKKILYWITIRIPTLFSYQIMAFCEKQRIK